MLVSSSNEIGSSAVGGIAERAYLIGGERLTTGSNDENACLLSHRHPFGDRCHDDRAAALDHLDLNPRVQR